MPELLELSTITFKDGLTSPPPATVDALNTLAASPGLIAVYFGQHIEDPTKFTWVARWTGQAAIDAMHASPSFGPWAASYIAPLSSYAISTSVDYTGDAAAALEAPCTEFFSSFGADDDYLEARLYPFTKALLDAKLPNQMGGVAGEFVPVTHVGVDEPERKLAVLMLGWGAKEDHEAQRGEGKGIYLRALFL